MNTNDLISIIVPVYKVEPYLEECLDSIVGQTYKNLEIILIDDGSPDDCGAICDSYALKDTRIKVIHQDNRGLSEARNSGMNIMTGKFFAFVDSDDIIHTKYIETLYQLITTNNTDLSMCGLFEFQDGTPIHKPGITATRRDFVISEYEFAACLLEGYTLPYTVCWDKLYTTRKFGTLRFQKQNRFEDNCFLADCIFIGATCSKTNLPLYMHRKRKDSICSAKDCSYVQGRVECWIYQYNRLKERYGADYRQSLFCMVLKRISRLATDVYWNLDKNLTKKIYSLWLTFYNSNKQTITNKNENSKIQLYKYFPTLYYHFMKNRIFSIFIG